MVQVQEILRRRSSQAKIIEWRPRWSSISSLTSLVGASSPRLATTTGEESITTATLTKGGQEGDDAVVAADPDPLPLGPAPETASTARSGVVPPGTVSAVKAENQGRGRGRPRHSSHSEAALQHRKERRPSGPAVRERTSSLINITSSSPSPPISSPPPLPLTKDQAPAPPTHTRSASLFDPTFSLAASSTSLPSPTTYYNNNNTVPPPLPPKPPTPPHDSALVNDYIYRDLDRALPDTPVSPTLSPNLRRRSSAAAVFRKLSRSVTSLPKVSWEKSASSTSTKGKTPSTTGTGDVDRVKPRKSSFVPPDAPPVPPIPANFLTNINQLDPIHPASFLDPPSPITNTFSAFDKDLPFATDKTLPNSPTTPHTYASTFSPNPRSRSHSLAHPVSPRLVALPASIYGADTDDEDATIEQRAKIYLENTSRRGSAARQRISFIRESLYVASIGGGSTNGGSPAISRATTPIPPDPSLIQRSATPVPPPVEEIPEPSEEDEEDSPAAPEILRGTKRRRSSTHSAHLPGAPVPRKFKKKSTGLSQQILELDLASSDEENGNDHASAAESETEDETGDEGGEEQDQINSELVSTHPYQRRIKPIFAESNYSLAVSHLTASPNPSYPPTPLNNSTVALNSNAALNFTGVFPAPPTGSTPILNPTPQRPGHARGPSGFYLEKHTKGVSFFTPPDSPQNQTNQQQVVERPPTPHRSPPPQFAEPASPASTVAPSFVTQGGDFIEGEYHDGPFEVDPEETSTDEGHSHYSQSSDHVDQVHEEAEEPVEDYSYPITFTPYASKLSLLVTTSTAALHLQPAKALYRPFTRIENDSVIELPEPKESTPSAPISEATETRPTSLDSKISAVCLDTPSLTASPPATPKALWESPAARGPKEDWVTLPPQSAYDQLQPLRFGFSTANLFNPVPVAHELLAEEAESVYSAELQPQQEPEPAPEVASPTQAPADELEPAAVADFVVFPRKLSIDSHRVEDLKPSNVWQAYEYKKDRRGSRKGSLASVTHVVKRKLSLF